MWGVFFHQRTGLSFKIDGRGLRQHSHSRYESRGTNENILVSQNWALPPPKKNLEGQVPICIFPKTRVAQWTGFPFRRLLILAGLLEVFEPTSTRGDTFPHFCHSCKEIWKPNLCNDLIENIATKSSCTNMYLSADPSSRQSGRPVWKIKKVIVTQINVTSSYLLQKGQDFDKEIFLH
jgi:hypothetical protein